MNHSFACAKDAQKEPQCSQWCGNKHACLSTLTYASPPLQEAYEKGHFDAKWAMENELAKMAQTTSPHRRVAAEDFYRVLCKIRPVAFEIMPTAESTDGVEAVHVSVALWSYEYEHMDGGWFTKWSDCEPTGDGVRNVRKWSATPAAGVGGNDGR